MRYFILFYFAFSTFSLSAQHAPGLRDVVVDSARYRPTQHYRFLGLSYKSTRDKALSPLLFQGPGLSFATSSWKYRNHWLWQSTFSAEGHLLQNAPASALLSNASLSYSLAALRELNKIWGKKWRVWAGPEASMFLNLRLHSNNTNNIAAYEWVTALGGAGMLSREFSLWDRNFAISNQVQLPLLYLYSRPPFAWGIPPGIYEDQEGGWKEAFQAGTLNDIFFISNQLNFDFQLRKQKKGKLLKYTAYRLAYTWHYFQVRTRNSVQSGGHALRVSRIITF